MEAVMLFVAAIIIVAIHDMRGRLPPTKTSCFSPKADTWTASHFGAKCRSYSQSAPYTLPPTACS